MSLLVLIVCNFLLQYCSGINPITVIGSIAATSESITKVFKRTKTTSIEKVIQNNGFDRLSLIGVETAASFHHKKINEIIEHWFNNPIFSNKDSSVIDQITHSLKEYSLVDHNELFSTNIIQINVNAANGKIVTIMIELDPSNLNTDGKIKYKIHELLGEFVPASDIIIKRTIKCNAIKCTTSDSIQELPKITKYEHIESLLNIYVGFKQLPLFEPNIKKIQQ
jgi:hypothetical protein